MSCSAICVIAGRRAVIRLAVNHLPTRRRHRWCSSPLSGMICAISLLNSPPDSSADSLAASSAFSSRVKRGSASTCLTSSYRVSSVAWSPLGSSTGATGHCCRSCAHSAGGSSAVSLGIG
ncbi:hypothetical protein FHR33_000200 [Nonomuraea dietziae]|uniref:Uncharacterized protein n=1 Tax=Nonomuraea dietziae TaxID=65515 RepID=A0A7W5UYG9_9ACTN|nr:hypothetical protein [Nonomuraea dietziae]